MAAVASCFVHIPTPRTARNGRVIRVQGMAMSERAAVNAVIASVADAKGRGKEGVTGQQFEELMRAVEVLEAIGGTPEPIGDPMLDGRWRLLFTTTPSSASPIQRTFTGVEAFKIFQEVSLSDTSTEARVNNVVVLGSLGELRVEARASTALRPIEGFVPRKGDGLILGLPIFGKSTSFEPMRDGIRVDFAFDNAFFSFKNVPFKIPYPVPFRLLGDEAKGFIDVTYMGRTSDGKLLRLTRGNKGTLFVLMREDDS